MISFEYLHIIILIKAAKNEQCPDLGLLRGSLN
jgi:hypothetical protein